MPSVIRPISVAVTTAYNSEMSWETPALIKIQCKYCRTWQYPIHKEGTKLSCLACGAPLEFPSRKTGIPTETTRGTSANTSQFFKGG